MTDTLDPYLNQIYFYYKPKSSPGYYYALDGEAVLDCPPVGYNNTTSSASEPSKELSPHRLKNVPHAFDLGYDDPVGDKVLRAYWEAMSHMDTELSSNKEAYYLLAERGSTFAFGWQKGLTLSSKDFQFHDSTTSAAVDKKNNVAGVTSGANNRIIFYTDPTSNNASFIVPTFREEVSHLVDFHIARELELNPRNTWLWSHKLVSDDMIASDISYLQKLEDSRRRKAKLERTHDLPEGVSAEKMISGVKDALTIPQTPYDEIRNTHDSDFMNNTKDTENMVKFHVFRMELEDLYAKEHGTPPDHYSTDSPMLRALADVAPGLTAAYRDKWLPAVNIVTQTPNSQQRKAQLLALATTNGLIVDAPAAETNESQIVQQWLPSVPESEPELSR